MTVHRTSPTTNRRLPTASSSHGSGRSGRLSRTPARIAATADSADDVVGDRLDEVAVGQQLIDHDAERGQDADTRARPLDPNGDESCARRARSGASVTRTRVPCPGMPPDRAPASEPSRVSRPGAPRRLADTGRAAGWPNVPARAGARDRRRRDTKKPPGDPGGFELASVAPPAARGGPGGQCEQPLGEPPSSAVRKLEPQPQPRDGVRVVHREAGAHERVDVVDLAARQERRCCCRRRRP